MIWNFIREGIFGALLWGMLGYFIGLGIILFLFAKGWLKRENPAGKFFVVTYWVFIPVIFAFGFTILKATFSAKALALETADEVVEQFETRSYPMFKEYVSDNLDELKISMPSNDELATKFLKESSLGDNWVTHEIMVLFLDIVEGKAESSVANTVDMEQESVHAVRLMETGSLDAIYHDAFGMLKRKAHGIVSGIFAPYIWIPLIIWIGLMIFPVVEMIWYGKKKAKDPAID